MVSMQSAGYRIITVVLKMQLLIIQLIVQGTKGFLSLYFYCHSMYIKREQIFRKKVFKRR